MSDSLDTSTVRAFDYWSVRGNIASLFCLTRVRCQLCRFLIEDGDRILATRTNSEGGVTEGFSRTNFSVEFQVRQGEYYEAYPFWCTGGQSRKLEIHMCLNRLSCQNRYSSSSIDYMCHISCREVLLLVRPDGAPSSSWVGSKWVEGGPPGPPAFRDATRYDFDPPPSEEGRRAEHIRHELACSLLRWAQPAAGPQLPVELWRMVAEHLLAECAVVDALEWLDGGRGHPLPPLPPSNGNGSGYDVDLACPVYASFTKMEGRRYIKSVSNVPNRMNVLVIPGWDAATAKDSVDGEDGDIFIASDHLGIRQIVFVPSGRREAWSSSLQILDPSLWWRRIMRNASHQGATTTTDCLKMRRLEMSEMATSSVVGIRWQLPIAPPPKVLDMITLSTPEKIPSFRWMTFFECNSPDITGYTVATDGWRVSTVLAHKLGETVDAGSYKLDDYNRDSIHWVHMPINRGERIVEILAWPSVGWISGELGVAGIVLRTDQNRAVQFAWHGIPDDVRFSCIPLGLEPTRIWFNRLHRHDRTDSIQHIALEMPEHRRGAPRFESSWQVRRRLPLLPCISPVPMVVGTDFRLSPIYTRCSMRALREVHLCRVLHNRQGKLVSMVKGFIVVHADGRREAVGECRLDWISAGDALRLEDTDRLYVRGERFDGEFPYVAEVTKRAPESREGNDEWTTWLDLSQRGTLEWWFTIKKSLMCHDGLWLDSSYDDFEEDSGSEVVWPVWTPDEQ